MIVRGRGVMTVGDERRGVRAGELVFVPPGLGHAIRNDRPETLVFTSAMAPPFDHGDLEPVFAYGPR